MVNQELGLEATRAAARRYGHEPDTETANWYDTIHPERGTKMEVKSTVVRDGEGRIGRFVLYRSQLDSLSAANKRGSAYVCFVLRSGGDSDDWPMKRMRPRNVRSIVDGWGRTSHPQFSEETRIPWTRVFSKSEV